jgi:exodeoxyribonuclease VII large subunit
MGLSLITGRIRQIRTETAALGLRLDSLSYQKVLERGFVLVTTVTSRPLTKATSIRPGSEMLLRFGDGTVAVKAARKGDKGQLPLL